MIWSFCILLFCIELFDYLIFPYRTFHSIVCTDNCITCKKSVLSLPIMILLPSFYYTGEYLLSNVEEIVFFELNKKTSKEISFVSELAKCIFHLLKYWKLFSLIYIFFNVEYFFDIFFSNVESFLCTWDIIYLITVYF